MAVLPLVVTIDGQSWLEYEDVSAEEKARRERAREGGTGIVGYSADDDAIASCSPSTAACS